MSVTAGRDPRRAAALRDARGCSPSTPARCRCAAAAPAPGSVALVGGGPGDPGLLTVRGRQLLAGADVVVRDRLAPDVDLADGVEVVEVGKSARGPSWRQERHRRAARARRRSAGRRVVRLKGGDVHVFARGIEEVAACVAAGVPVEVVPGVSSALAAPTLAGIPVTARGVNQSFTVVSAHLDPADPGSHRRLRRPRPARRHAACCSWPSSGSAAVLRGAGRRRALDPHARRGRAGRARCPASAPS